MSLEQKRIEREWFELAEMRDQYREKARQEKRAGKVKDAISTTRQWSAADARCKILEAEFRALMDSEGADTKQSGPPGSRPR